MKPSVTKPLTLNFDPAAKASFEMTALTLNHGCHCIFQTIFELPRHRQALMATKAVSLAC